VNDSRQGSSAVFIRGEEVEGRNPEAIKRRGVPFPGISSKSDLAIRRRFGASQRGRKVTGGTGVVRV
jgi:hypothetical protein